jgi:mediator of RNA polymerase II transcription subunit 6
VNQGQFNQALAHAISTREGLEARLKSMSGLEFMVAEEPTEMAVGTGTGVWVIRKQARRKRPGQSDEITVLATYFIVNDTIFVAPALGDILNSRLVS